MVIAISGASATSLAGIALAATARHASHRSGQFKTWPAAQRAAGFRLLKPTTTYNLPRSGHITVVGCPAGPGVPKGTQLVLAQYTEVPRLLELYQDNARHSCVQLPKTKFIAKVHVDGTTARLTRYCGAKPAPSCKSKTQFLILTWVRGGRFYLAISLGLRQGQIVGFGRGLIRVK